MSVVRTCASTVLPASRSLAASQSRERASSNRKEIFRDVFAVFAQPLSVVPHHNSLLPRTIPVFEVRKEATQRGIRVRRFSVVQPVLVNLGIRRRPAHTDRTDRRGAPKRMRPGWVHVQPRFCALLHIHPRRSRRPHRDLLSRPPGSYRRTRTRSSPVRDSCYPKITAPMNAAVL